MLQVFYLAFQENKAYTITLSVYIPISGDFSFFLVKLSLDLGKYFSPFCFLLFFLDKPLHKMLVFIGRKIPLQGILRDLAMYLHSKQKLHHSSRSGFISARHLCNGVIHLIKNEVYI